MKKNIKTILIIIICFLAYYIAFENFEILMLLIGEILNNRLLSYFVTYLLIGMPIFFGVFIVNNDHKILSNLGLLENVLQGIFLSSIFSLPMFIGGFLFNKLNNDINLSNLVVGTIFAGIFEELYFRGFLFGQIFKNTKLGFLPSIFLSAIIFSFGHIYQSQILTELVGIFIITFLGAILFAWLFVEWNHNLWIPIFLHTLMNLSWNIFSISNNALGNLNANIFRGLTIAFAIIFTIIYKIRKGQKMSININTLLIKK
jgi:membrane protease YdiL (CAAX protease family)